MKRTIGGLAIAALLGFTSLGNAQEAGQRAPAAPKPVPRTADGKPDFSGVWSTRAVAATQILEEHAEEPPFSRAGKTIIVDPADGRIPYQPWALKERDWRRISYNNYHDPDTHCHLPGPVRGMFDMNLPILILQPPGHIVMLHELVHAYRAVAMDGRPHLRDRIRLWQGDSIGRWDGDTLVVETTNNNGKTWLAQFGDFVSDAVKVTERLTMADGDTINYRATFEDPKVFTRAWTVGFQLGRNTDTEMLEAACWEDNRDPQYMKSLLPPGTVR